MITTASQAFMAKVNNGEIPSIRMQFVTAEGTSYWINDGQFWADSISFSEATSQNGEFTVGSAVIGQFEFSLNNFDGTFRDELFEGATVIPFVYYSIDGTNEYLPKGLYYIADHKTSGNIIRCTAYDGLKLLDEHQTNITYPATVQAIVQNICTANGITLATTAISGGTYEVTTAPDDSVTDRQLLSYVCQITGNFARMDENGHLVVGWYDFANPVVITSTFDGKDLWTNPITLTGVLGATQSANTESAAETEYLYGTMDHIVEIRDNELINSNNLEAVITAVGERICGVTFRPGSLPILANPCIQAGDVLQITDNITHVVYLFPVTSLTYTKGLTESVTCDFESEADVDLRVSSEYRIRASVEQAKQQAESADEIARAAQEMAQTSGFTPMIISDKGTALNQDTTIHLTAVIYDHEMNEVDPDGTEYLYRWWVTKDGIAGSYLAGGKVIPVEVDDSLCDFAAGIYFETRDITETFYPFALCNRSNVILTNRACVPLTARAAGGST